MWPETSDDDGVGDEDGDYGWAKCDFSEVILDFPALTILRHFHCGQLQTLNRHAYGDDDDACLPS
jgi:hypothetical protein